MTLAFVLIGTTLIGTQAVSAQMVFTAKNWSQFPYTTNSMTLIGAQYACDDDDIDNDDDGLIELCFLEDLDAVRHQLAGAAYQSTSGAIPTSQGCPSNSCRGYELVRDLDFNDDDSYRNTANQIGWTTGTGWVPIGQFSGIFEGNGYTLSNLTITASDRAGLFLGLKGESVSASGIINGIGLLNAVVHGNGFVGSLVVNNSGSITNSYSTGQVSGAGNFTGIGGLVGLNNGTITNSYSACRVVSSTNTSFVGGLVGENRSGAVLSNNYSAGAVSSNYVAGGLVGLRASSVMNSYSTGLVTAANQAGGLVGVRNTFSPETRDSYWDLRTSKLSISAGGIGKVTAELQTPTTASGIYSNWSDSDWDFGTAYQYPAIKYSVGTHADYHTCGTSQQPPCGALLSGADWKIRRVAIVTQTELQIDAEEGEAVVLNASREDFEYRWARIGDTSFPLKLNTTRTAELWFVAPEALVGSADTAVTLRFELTVSTATTTVRKQTVQIVVAKVDNGLMTQPKLRIDKSSRELEVQADLASDADGAGAILGYQWQKCSGSSATVVCSSWQDVVSDGMAASYLIPEEGTVEGDRFRVQLTYTDGQNHREVAPSEVYTIVHQQAPIITDIDSITTIEGEVVEIVAEASDVNFDNLSYAWRVTTGDKTPSILAHSTVSSATLVFTIPNDWADTAQTTLVLSVAVSDGAATSTKPVIVNITRTDNGGLIAKPTITRNGRRLTVSANLESDPDGVGTAQAYRWQICLVGADCNKEDQWRSTATSSSYRIPDAELVKDNQFRVQFTYRDGQNYQTTLTSTPYRYDNQKPTVESMDNQVVVTIGTTLSKQILVGVFEDADGDTLSYIASGLPPDSNLMLGTDGTLMTRANARVVGTATTSATSAVTVEVTANDGSSIATTTFKLFFNAETSGTVTITVNDILSQLEASDDARDANGIRSKVYQWYEHDGSAFVVLTGETLFTYTLPDNKAARGGGTRYQLVAVVTDHIGQRTTLSAVYTIANQAPLITDIGSLAVAEGQVVEIVVEASDANFDDLSYLWHSTTGDKTPSLLADSTVTSATLRFTIPTDWADTTQTTLFLSVAVRDGTTTSTKLASVLIVRTDNGGLIARPTITRSGRRLTVSADLASDPDGGGTTQAYLWQICLANADCNEEAQWRRVSGASTNSFYQIPDAELVKSNQFRVQLSYRDGQNYPRTLASTPWNHPNQEPTLSASIEAQFVTIGTTLNKQILVGVFEDADGDVLSYAASGLPDSSNLRLSADGTLMTRGSARVVGTATTNTVSAVTVGVVASDGSSTATTTFKLFFNAQTSGTVVVTADNALSQLQASDNATDANGITSRTYQWYEHNGSAFVALMGETHSIYRLPPDKEARMVGTRYQVTVVVTDRIGQRTTLSAVHTIANRIPVLMDIAPIATTEGEVVEIVARASDANFDDLSYAWHATTGDKTPSLLAHSTLTNATLRFTIPTDWADTTQTTLFLSVTVGDGVATSTKLATVNIARIDNGGLTTTPIIAESNRRLTVAADLRSDPDGDGTIEAYQWQRCLSSIDTVVCSVWQSVSESASYLIPPEEMFAGSRFRVRLVYTDGQGYRRTVISEVLIIANHAPIITDIDPIVTTEGEVVTVIAQASDANFDDLSYAWHTTTGDKTPSLLADSIVASATLVFTVPKDWADTAQTTLFLAVAVGDGVATSTKLATVNITRTDNGGLTTTPTIIETNRRLTVSANLRSDPDGGGIVQAYQWQLCLANANCNEEGQWRSASGDATSSSYQTPDVEAIKNNRFRVRLSYRDGQNYQRTLTSTPWIYPNQKPTLSASIGDQFVTIGTTLNKQILIGVFEDADGDSLSYTATGLPPDSNLILSEDGILMTRSNARVVGTATTDIAVTVELTADDGNNGTATTTFRLFFNAQTSGTVAITADNALSQLQASDNATDANGITSRTYQWSKYDGSAFVALAGETHSIYTLPNNKAARAAGTRYQVAVVITDRIGQRTTLSAVHTIANRAPRITDAEPIATTEGEVVTIVAQASDVNFDELNYLWSMTIGDKTTSLLADSTVTSTTLVFTVPTDWASTAQATLSLSLSVGDGATTSTSPLIVDITRTENGGLATTPTIVEVNRRLTVWADLSGDPDGGGTVQAYQWQLCLANTNCSQEAQWKNISGATDDSYQIPKDEAVDNQFRVQLTYRDGQDYQTTVTSEPLTYVALRILDIEPIATTEGEVVTIVARVNVSSGNLIYGWHTTTGDKTPSILKDSTVTSATLVFTVPSDWASTAQTQTTVSLLVSVSDGETTGTNLAIVNITRIDNGGLATTPTITRSGNKLTVSADLDSDPDGGGTVQAYQWQLCRSSSATVACDNDNDWGPAPGAQSTASSYIIPEGDTVKEDDQFRVQLSYNDGQDYRRMVISEVFSYQQTKAIFMRLRLFLEGALQ